MFYFIFYSYEIFVALRQVVGEDESRKRRKRKKKLELVIISKVQNRILGRIEIAINPEDDPN
jgi:hypothetical protein